MSGLLNIPLSCTACGSGQAVMSTQDINHLAGFSRLQAKNDRQGIDWVGSRTWALQMMAGDTWAGLRSYMVP